MADSASNDGGPASLSLATDDRHVEQASAAAQDEEKELAMPDGASDAGKRNLDVDVMAQGIACVLGPVMNGFDGGVEGALKSQSVLASSIDRLTRELDKLLEDVPHPYATHHAARLSGIRKRVISLNTTLHIIQKRMDMIQRLLAGYASRAASRANQEKALPPFMEGSRPTSGDVLLRELLPSEVSRGSADNTCGNDEERAKAEDCEMSEFSRNLPFGGSREDSDQEKEAIRNDFNALNKEEAVADQELVGGVAIDEARNVHAQAVIDQVPCGGSVAMEEKHDVDVQRE